VNPFFFKIKVLKKLRITHFLLPEVVDYPLFVGVIFHGVHHVYIRGNSILVILGSLE
jgi:hypothetical protein